MGDILAEVVKEVGKVTSQTTSLKRQGWGSAVSFPLAIGYSVWSFKMDIKDDLKGYQTELSNNLKDYQTTVSRDMAQMSNRLEKVEEKVANQNGFNTRLERIEQSQEEVKKYLKTLKKEVD